jgi:hypothetical protein
MKGLREGCLLCAEEEPIMGKGSSLQDRSTVTRRTSSPFVEALSVQN